MHRQTDRNKLITITLSYRRALKKVDKSGENVCRLYTSASIINILYRVENIADMIKCLFFFYLA